MAEKTDIVNPAAGVTISFQPGEVWDFWKAHKSDLVEMQALIAYNQDTKYEVYVTDDNGLPQIIVYKGEVSIYQEGAVSQTDCKETVRRTYTKYLFPITVRESDSKVSAKADDVDSKEPDEDELNEDEYHAYVRDSELHGAFDDRSPEEIVADALTDEALEREDELLYGFYDFMNVILDNGLECYFNGIYDEEFEDIMDEVLRVIASHGVPIRRPTFITASDGSEEYIEYPYDEFISVEGDSWDA